MKKVISAIYLISLTIFVSIFIIREKIQEIEPETWKQIEIYFFGTLFGIVNGFAIWSLRPIDKSEPRPKKFIFQKRKNQNE